MICIDDAIQISKDAVIGETSMVDYQVTKNSGYCNIRREKYVILAKIREEREV